MSFKHTCRVALASFHQPATSRFYHIARMQDRWTPPPDPHRPRNPYFPGFSCEILPHTPPSPFGTREYPEAPRTSASQQWLRQANQTQVVLNYPPIETVQQASTIIRFPKANLSITRSIAIGNGRGPQLALCTITPQDVSEHRPPFTAVAKIYDALYYPFINSMIPRPSDVCLEADGDYSRETAAYEHLSGVGLLGGFTPDYYGSWTMNVPMRMDGYGAECGNYVRPVRLVLLEALHGPNMMSVFARNSPYAEAEPNAFHYTEEYRLEVMAQVLEGETRQFHAGVRQSDLAPRNIMLADDPRLHGGSMSRDSAPRVVLVDYDRAIVFQRTTRGVTALHEKPLPQNPSERFRRDDFREFIGWVPESWHQGEDRGKHTRLAWLERTFGGEKAASYEPVEQQEEDSNSGTEYD